MDYKSQLMKLWLPLQGWLVALLVIVCGIWLAQITWMLVQPAPVVLAPKVMPAVSDSAQQGQDWLQMSRSIGSREFFGQVAVAAEQVAEPAAVEAPETKLNLTLQGVMAEGDGQGFAVIGEGRGSGKVFSLGEDIFGQATLANVFGDRIILDRRGQLETLRYEKIASDGILKPVNQNDDINPSPIASFREALSQASVDVANGATMQSQVQGMVEYVGRRANEDPEGFISEMGLEPTAEGYQVTRQARQLQMVGLRPGDLVTSVNDMPVGNISNDQALLNQVLQMGGEIKIQIRRGSRSFTIYQTIPTF
jgi:general secretion pathway protein C